MIKVFLDTNVIIDFLAKRKPFDEAAAEIFSLADLGKIKIYISAISVNNVYYILKKPNGHKKTLSLINDILLLAELVDLNSMVIKEAKDSSFADFEDAIQYYSALKIKEAGAIITRDKRDFKKSKIAVLTPVEFVAFQTSS